jgi:hypothetical protein
MGKPESRRDSMTTTTTLRAGEGGAINPNGRGGMIDPNG